MSPRGLPTLPRMFRLIGGCGTAPVTSVGRAARSEGEGLNIWEVAFNSHAADLMTSETFEAWDRSFVGELKAKPVWSLMWSRKSEAYSTGFQAHVASSLSRN